MADATNVVVAGTGSVYVAPVGTALPTDIATALAAAYVELGFTTEDGVTRTIGQTVDDINAWQSFYPIRKVQTAKSGTLAFTLHEYNPDTVAFAFGGGAVDVATGPPAVATYTPPAPGDIDYRSLVVEYSDGGDSFRFVVPRGMVSGDVESNLTRTSALDLPISFDVVPAGSPVVGDPTTQPWFEISDKAVFTTP